MIATYGWALPLRQAWGELRGHKLRTFVTSGAVFLGVASLLSMTSLSRGMEASNTRMYLQMGGAQVIQLSTRNPRDPIQAARFAQSPGFRLSDLDGLRKQVSGLARVVPELSVPRGTVRTNGKSIRAMATASTWDRFALLNATWDREIGLSKPAWDRGAAIAVVGPDVAVQISPKRDPLGATFQVGSKTYVIAGIFKVDGKFDMRSREIVLPFEAWRRDLGASNPVLASARIEFISIEAARSGRDAVWSEMIALHRGVEDVDVSTNEDVLKDAQETLRMMALVTISIATVCLLSGAIGILNVLLSSLSARLRELGIAKALGATSRLLFRQIFLEGFLVAALGAVTGCAVGSVPVWAFQGMLPWDPQLTLNDYFLGVGLALAMGTGVGLLPAWKASRLNPIEAMRA